MNLLSIFLGVLALEAFILILLLFVLALKPKTPTISKRRVKDDLRRIKEKVNEEESS